MNNIKVFTVLKPNTLKGVSEEIKLRCLLFTVDDNIIDVLEEFY